MLLWVVVVTVALATTDAQMDRCGYFHEGCSVELGFGELILKCTLSSGNLTVKVDRSASYLKIICEEPFTPLLCDKLEYAKKYIDIYIDTSRKNKNLESLLIKTCNMPSESLACLLDVVGANGTSEVTLSEVEGDLEAVNLKGLEGVTKFVIVDFRIFHTTGSIPYKALSHLPNLRSLIIYGDVNVISEPDYVLSELKTLEVVRGTIECMSKGAFKSTPEIQMLSFDRDEILFIDVDAFEGLTKLVNFTLRYTNFWRQLPGGIFRHTPNLLYLSLFGSSSVRDFPDDLFAGLKKVKQISITHIEAKWILSNRTFSNLPSLYDLQLDNSLIEIVPAEPFKNSTNLKKISLAFNKIKYIPNNTFKGLKLTYLDLSHNNISYLNSDVFSEQTSMTKLNLSHNDLKSLPGELFSNMNSLEILDLGHNSIEFLNKSIFNGLGNLRELSLNDNQLEYLDHAVFEFTSSLEVLSWSKIREDEGRFCYIPDLRPSVSHNKLTISKRKNVRKIIEVSFSLDGEESASRVIAYHSPLKNLVRLRTLDLSHNNVFIICEDWTQMLNLTELDLSYNNFTSLSVSKLNGDSLDMASNWRGPDKECRNEVNGDLISVNCTLPSGNPTLEVSRSNRNLFIYCSKNSTLVCDELQEAKPFFDKYKDTGSRDDSFNGLFINTCNLPNESLACLLGVVGANGTGLVKVYLNGVAGKLEPVHLEGLEGVTELIMYDVDKSTASIPYNALSLLPNLKIFSMRQAFVELTPDTDKVLSKLTTLELERCGIKSAPKGAFKTVHELQKLTLMYNKIEFIDVDAFEGLTKLEVLTLSGNLLTHLPGDVFRHTPNIIYLNLFANKLLDLSDDLFTGLKKLKKISLFNNKAVLKLSNKTFSNLPSLDELQLGNSRIEILSAELFRNTTNLKKIFLEQNNIKYIPSNTFKGLKLIYLSLSYNKISYLNSYVFSEQTSMTELMLNYNDLKSLPGKLFSNMNSLKKLDLGHNSIGFLDKSTFEGLYNLKDLSLTENRIEHIDKETFAPTVSLEVLFLSKNNLTIETEKVGRNLYEYCSSPMMSLRELRILDLSHNNISVFCADWTSRHSFKLDLSYNYITSLPRTVTYGNDFKVDLRHNNIQQFKPPVSLHQSSKEATFLMDYNPYRCDCNLYDFIHNYTLGIKMFKFDIDHAECAQPPALKGVKLVNLEPEVLTCDVDCKTGDIIKHPSNDSNCKCILNKYRRRIEMFCDYLPDVYPELPEEIKYTYLKLRYVTDLQSLPAEVEIVDFSSLNLTEPPIANSVALNLSNNYLTKAPLELFQRNCSVYLSNNPFDCTCGGKDNVLALNAFKNLIPDYKNLTCSNGIFVSNTVVEQLCAAKNGLIISLSLGIIGILIVTCTIIAFKYTTELRIILRELGLWREDVLCGEVYDAFVTFAHQDEDFVSGKLLPKLEKGKPPLKICIHYRDWVIGDYIPEQISRSVDQSRYTIIVLSRNFVESMWGRMEFRTAHAKDRAIILMLDDLSADKSLDPELKAYISMKTYVKADDPLVWERLRDAVLRRRRGNSKLNKADYHRAGL